MCVGQRNSFRVNTENMRVDFALLVVLAALLCKTTLAAEGTTIVHDGVSVEFPADREDLAKHCLEVIAQARPELLTRLDLHVPDEFTVKLFAHSAEYDLFTAGRIHPHSLGVAFPYARLIAIDASLTSLPTAFDFAATVRHEVLHLAIGRLHQETQHEVPLWFNEGVAVWFSGQNILRAPRVLPRAAVSGYFYSLSALGEVFPKELTNLALAYEESESAIRFLEDEFGNDVLRKIIETIRETGDFDSALRAVTGLDMIAFERDWRDHLKSKYRSWLAIVSSISLFTVLSVATIAAYLILKVRGWRTMKQWDEEEQQGKANFGSF